MSDEDQYEDPYPPEEDFDEWDASDVAEARRDMESHSDTEDD